jgi:outer membrane protein assembly factor BamB
VAVVAPPALAGGSLFVPTADGLQVLAAGGCGSAECVPVWTAAAGDVRTQPAVAGGVVFAGAEDGAVSAYPAAGCGAATCAPVWSTSTGSALTGGPVVANGQLYVGTGDGRLVAYRPAA